MPPPLESPLSHYNPSFSFSSQTLTNYQLFMIPSFLLGFGVTPRACIRWRGAKEVNRYPSTQAFNGKPSYNKYSNPAHRQFLMKRNRDEIASSPLQFKKTYDENRTFTTHYYNIMPRVNNRASL
jgi:hypothetical protein